MNWNDQSMPKDSDFEIVKKLIDRMMLIYIDNSNKKILIHCR